MAPKVPSAKQLGAELAQTVREMYADGKSEEVTVNLVRTLTEKRLGLEQGFFKDDAWKAQSKQIIMATAENIDNEPKTQSSPQPVSKSEPKEQGNGKKRAARDENEPPKKKRLLTKPKPAAKKPESELSELSDSDMSERPTKRKQPAKRGGRKAKRVMTSDSDEDDEQEEESPEEDEDADSDDFNSSDSEPKPKKRAPKNKSSKKTTAKQPEADVEGPAAETDSPLSEPAEEDSEKPAEEIKATAIDESSESEVFDEPPKRKRKTKEPAAKASRKPPKSRSAKTKSTADLSPDAAEIKKLQGYLVKCGVRKIWGVELKQYGDDSRAKIRHLRNMLKQVGMDGRFSEQKAREIKERRELLADLEAVKEMNENLDWGTGGGGRSSRSRAARPKTLKLEDDDDDEDVDVDRDDSAAKGTDSGDGSDEDDDDEEESRNPRARAMAKRRADFAFLGDDEESD